MTPLSFLGFNEAHAATVMAYFRGRAMTKEEFERGYAERGGISLEQLHAWGRGAVPCDCGAPECAGWQMVNLEDYAEHMRLIEWIAATRDHFPGQHPSA